MYLAELHRRYGIEARLLAKVMWAVTVTVSEPGSVEVSRGGARLLHLVRASCLGLELGDLTCCCPVAVPHASKSISTTC